MQMSSSEEARDFIDMVGVKNALRLSSYRRFFYIPQKASTDIITVLGKDLAKTVCYNFGGIYISLPLEKLRLSIRNDAIIRCYHADVKTIDIASLFKLSRQSVSKIIKQYRNPENINQQPAYE